MHEHNDIELLRFIADGEPAALEALYDRYENQLFAFAYRLMHDRIKAEEVVQELFTRIRQSAERFNPDQGEVLTWTFAITRSIAIDALRKKHNRQAGTPAPDDQFHRIRYGRPGSEEEAELRLMGEEVQRALHYLNLDQQEVVELIYYQGYTHQEVSEIKIIPPGTVKSRVRLALKQLKKNLEHLGKERTRT